MPHALRRRPRTIIQDHRLFSLRSTMQAPGTTERSRQLTAHPMGIPKRRRYIVSKSRKSRDSQQPETHDLAGDDEDVFPNVCSTCDKEFIPHDHMFLYCSENCRDMDKAGTSQSSSPVAVNTTRYFPILSMTTTTRQDFVPRASPSRTTPLITTSNLNSVWRF
ncbi:hypothetical protein B0T11DRAFT_272893 [Plectosphaerella cucumerina]|uniref:Uncharacterized protein n=1 Tax=Plectosphaerella cucumerina TaxID=40658 RepID=A0A8K0XAA3_9PEZI|nr:hypothetical protein B0T11DRAFT_272893 [Plectosphaerella cucumerina]